MYSFNYQRAKSVDDAAKVIAKNAEAKLLAGGQSLIAAMKLRLAKPPHLVDLGTVKGLSGIKADSKAGAGGAVTGHAEGGGSPPGKKGDPPPAGPAGGIRGRM